MLPQTSYQKPSNFSEESEVSGGLSVEVTEERRQAASAERHQRPSGKPIKFRHGIYLGYPRYKLCEGIYLVYPMYILGIKFSNKIMFKSF